LEFDSKVPYTVDRECEQIIRKLPNYKEYLSLPEYVNTVKLLRKGVGIHHAGLMPILREMTELLFARGFIKILFCTETMSVGINLPVKTTIFTDVNKFNGEVLRPLYSHEYTQAAGRAGRLGLDKVGHVIHLNNLFRNINSVSYKQLMNGKPQVLTSKFKISYNLILNLLDIGDNNLVQFANKSMVTCDIDNQLKDILNKISQTEQELDQMSSYCMNLRTPENVLEQFNKLSKNVTTAVNKKR
jgi:superfamily II RNA helicase